MNLSRKPNHVHALSLMPVVLLCAMVVHPVGVTVAQDIQAVSSRLEVVGNRIWEAAESGEYGQYEAIAKWHEIKEKIVSGAIAGEEITEAEALLLRIKLVEAEAREMAAALRGETFGDHDHDEQDGMEQLEGTPGRITAEQIVSQMDKNNDQKISRDEASEEVKQYFGSIDTNGDGVIDVKEAQVMAQYANHMQGPASTQPARNTSSDGSLAAMDRNGDGKISKEEASEDLRLYFGKYDINKDGVIDGREAKELEKYFKGAKTAEKTSPAGGFTAAQVVSFMDKNNDQKISPDEASADLKPYFDSFDTNGDGMIDVNEAGPIAEYTKNYQSSK